MTVYKKLDVVLFVDETKNSVEYTVKDVYDTPQGQCLKLGKGRYGKTRQRLPTEIIVKASDVKGFAHG